MINKLLNKMNMSDNSMILRIRKVTIIFLFKFKKLLYLIKTKTSLQRSNNKLLIFIARLIEIGICVGIVYFVSIIDNIVLDKYKIVIENPIVFSDIVIACIGLMGVILGLYYSNVETIYSNKYSNTSRKIASLFRNDNIINKSIDMLKHYIIFSIVVLAKTLLSENVGYILCAVFFIYTIDVFLVFFRKEKDINVLANHYSLVYNLNFDILNIFHIIEKKDLLFRDTNFQELFCKKVLEKLDIILELAKFGDKSSGNALVDFMTNNILLLDSYYSIKNNIKYNSRWYIQENKYKKWYTTNYIEVKMATDTRSFISPNIDLNKTWFEDKIIEINDICLNKLSFEHDYLSIIKYLNRLTYICNKGYIVWELPQIYRMLTKIKDAIVSLSLDAKNDNNIINENALMIENLVSSFSVLLLSIAKSLSELEPQKEMINSVEHIKHKDFYYDRILNNEICEKLYNTINVEINIENKLITPIWYLENAISKQYIKLFDDCCNHFIKIEEELFELSVTMFNNKVYENSLIVLTHIMEIIPKINYRYEKMRSNYQYFLEKSSKDNSGVTNMIKNNLLVNLNSLEVKALKLFNKNCLNFTGINWNKSDKFPDFLGYYYNQACSFLVSCLCSDKYNSFATVYQGFINTVFLYDEYIRSDVVKTEYNNNYKLDKIIAPFVEYAQISSLAIIWGEISGDKKWKSLVDKELEKFVSIAERVTLLENVVDLIKNKRLIFFGSRDAFLSEWSIALSNTIRNSKYNIYESDGYYGEKLKTNSDLIKKYCAHDFQSFGLKSDCYEVYLVECVNKYININKRYSSFFGWENRKNEN